MALFFKAIQSAIANKKGDKKWHIALVKTGMFIDTQKLGELIAEKASLTPGDVHNVIRNLATVMREQLLDSHTVRLDGLGTFTMTARSRGKGVDKEEDVTPNQIVSLKCRFTPEYTREPGIGVTRTLTKGAKFIHINRMYPNGVSNGEESGEKGGNNNGGGIDPDA